MIRPPITIGCAGHWRAVDHNCMEAAAAQTPRQDVAQQGTWLIRDDFERARFREMHQRLLALNGRAFALTLLVIVVSIPTARSSTVIILSLIAVGIFAVV